MRLEGQLEKTLNDLEKIQVNLANVLLMDVDLTKF